MSGIKLRVSFIWKGDGIRRATGEDCSTPFHAAFRHFSLR
jgi:hypothetical protein